MCASFLSSVVRDGGVPTTRLSSPGAALACLGDQGRPLGQLLGSGRGARKGFADFPSSGHVCAEATVASSSQKDECVILGGGFDQITRPRWDKAHFISGKNPRVNLFSLSLKCPVAMQVAMCKV